MYVIQDFQLIFNDSNVYLNSYNNGAKIPNGPLVAILQSLKNQPKLEITAEELEEVANNHKVALEQLKTILISKLNIIKPMLSRKFPLIYLNSNDAQVLDMLQDTLSNQYEIEVVPNDFVDFEKDSLVVFYRDNYSSDDFKRVHEHLKENVCLVTAGVVHNLLIIDNIYQLNSGLPTHFSNLQNIIAYLQSDIPATKNNWLLFYREMFKNKVEQFPTPKINACQKGYIAYCLHQFLDQYTNLWKTPTPMDQVNCFWHVDLSGFSVHTEAAVHSPFSTFDMKLNRTAVKEQELA